MREKVWSEHVLKSKTVNATSNGVTEKEERRLVNVSARGIETRSFVREAAAALVMVYGGEAITGQSYRILVLFSCGADMFRCFAIPSCLYCT